MSTSNYTAQVDHELRQGVPVGPRSNAAIVPRPAEGRHVRWSMRTYPGGAGQWLLMIKDQTGPGRHRQGPQSARTIIDGARWWVNA